MSDAFPPLQPKIILGVAAHPDDLDVGAGGALAHYASQGAEVHYLIVTDGGKGSDDPAMTSAQLTKIRHAEQQVALEAIGGKSVTFLDYPDGELEVTMQLKRELVKAIRTIKPDTVITMDPSVLYVANKGIINHPDHRVVGQATLDAVFPLARDWLTFPELATEGYEPHKTKSLLLINFDTANFSVDISDSIETKNNALKAHASQFGDLSELRWVQEMAEVQGKLAGYKYAEGFIRIDIG